MTKENTKDQETKETKITATGFLVTTDKEKVAGFCRLKEEGAKNKIFESLESQDRYEKRRVTAIQICSIALSNLWHIQSQRGENKGKIADAKTLSAILKEIVEEKDFKTSEMALYVNYLCKNTYYPWHNHDAEELYFIVSGKAKFESKDQNTEILSTTNTRLHKSFESHAITTSEKPVLSFVIWKNKFEDVSKLTKD